jgi:hypothetical protein
VNTTIENITRAIDPTLDSLIKRLLAEIPAAKVAVPLARCTRVWAYRTSAEQALTVDCFPGGGYRFRVADGHGFARRVEETYTQQGDHDAEVAAAAQIDADLAAVFGVADGRNA